MAIWGLIVVLCSLVLLLVTVPLALAAMIGIAQWTWSSGFLATLGVCLVVVTIFALFDPRERALRRKVAAEDLENARRRLLGALVRKR